VPPLMEPKPQVPKVTTRIFFKVKIDAGRESGLESGLAELTGTLVFGLFGDIAPKASHNFASLARCDQGTGVLSGKPLCYKNSIFHHIIPGFMIQGGDFVNNNGTGGETVFGSELIEDETFQVDHNRPYLLSSSNKGRPNSNGSQFFINMVKTPWLNGKHVVFGMVLEGQDFLKKIESLGTSTGKPQATVAIIDCGEMSLTANDNTVKYW